MFNLFSPYNVENNRQICPNDTAITFSTTTSISPTTTTTTTTTTITTSTGKHAAEHSEAKWKIIAKLCEDCGKQIKDQFLMKIDDRIWHERCLVCSCCGVLLAHSCYSRNNKFFCKMDYIRIFGIKCSRCCESIFPQDLVMKVRANIYHMRCFSCFVCCHILRKGEQFVLRDDQLLCETDFVRELSFSNENLSPRTSESTANRDFKSRVGRKGPKRPRTILTAAQRKQFKASFDLTPKPCRKIRETLAKDTGLTARVVQVWFQNQRAKVKKLQRKHKQDPEKNQNNSRNAESNGATKKSDKYFGLNTNSEIDDSSTDNIHQSQNYQPHTDNSYGSCIDDRSLDTFYSSDVSLDGSVNTEDVNDMQDLQDLLSNSNDTLIAYPNSSPNSGHINYLNNNNTNCNDQQQINPIHKLYLMHTSYFNNSVNRS